MKTKVDYIDAHRDIAIFLKQSSSSDSSLSDKLIKQLNSLYINSTDEEEENSNGGNSTSDSFNGSVDQMSKENKTIDGNKSKSSCVDSSDNTIDLYLSSIINKCLNNRSLFEIRPVFWKSVSYSLANNYKESVDESECRKRFKRLLKRYIEVLKNSKDEIEANVSLKCFKLLNSMDLSLFLDSDHQLVSDLRYKLWNNTRNGFKGQTSDQYFNGNEFQLNRESNQQITEYYLSLVVTQCLNNGRLLTNVPTIQWVDMFWRTVTSKLNTDYNLKTTHRNDCQLMFSKVIQKYIRVLETSQSVTEAENSFKSFHLLNSMDLYLFLTPEVNQLVVELRNRLWNGINQTPITSIRGPEDCCAQPYCASGHNPYFTTRYPTQKLSFKSIKTDFIDPM